MKVRLYVRRKSRQFIEDWLDDRYLYKEVHVADLVSYSHYFVMDEMEARRIKSLFPQRNMRIADDC